MIRKKSSGDGETGSNHLNKKIKIEDMGDKNEGDGDCAKKNEEKRNEKTGDGKKKSKNEGDSADAIKGEDKLRDASAEQIISPVANPLASLLGYGEDSDSDDDSE